jgi:hypothetical protein
MFDLVFLQYSVKFAVLMKCRFCVLYHSLGSDGITRTSPF